MQCGLVRILAQGPDSVGSLVVGRLAVWVLFDEEVHLFFVFVVLVGAQRSSLRLAIGLITRQVQFDYSSVPLLGMLCILDCSWLFSLSLVHTPSREVSLARGLLLIQFGALIAPFMHVFLQRPLRWQCYKTTLVAGCL